MSSLFQHFDLVNWFLSFMGQSSLLITSVCLVDKSQLIKAVDLRALLWRLTVLGCVALAIMAILPFGNQLPMDLRNSGFEFLVFPGNLGGTSAAAGIETLSAELLSSIVIVWAFISIGLLIIYGFGGWMALKKLGYRKPLPKGHVLQQLLLDLSGDVIGKQPPLTVVPNLSSPFCLFSKEICLPKWCLDELTYNQQKAILAHEVAHIVHRDPLFFIFMDIVTKVFFFQPLLYLAVRNMRKSAELSADQWATDATGDAQSLAEVLLTCAKYLSNRDQPKWGIAMAKSPSNLRLRMEKLIMQKNVKPTRLLIKLAAMMTISGAAIAMPNVALIKGQDIEKPVDSKYLPIVRVQPKYPKKAAEQCLNGYVVVAFTVKSDGSVADPRVVESDPEIFNGSALRAALEFKYRPRKENGKFVDTPDVRTKFNYKVRDTCEVKAKPE